MARHATYGLLVEAERAIPGLRQVDATVDADVVVRFGALRVPQRAGAVRFTAAIGDDEDGLEVLEVDEGRGLWFRYGDGVEALVEHDGRSVRLSWPESLSFEDAVTYLVGPVLGTVARMHGRHCLHASAVVVDGCALVVMGAAGAGKSTTAARLVQRGFPLLSEDVLAVRDQTLVAEPGYARIKLWAPSVEALYGAPDALPRIVPTHPTWDKRHLDVLGEAERFSTSSAPLAAIYVLDGWGAADAPRLEPVPLQGRVPRLVANSYTGYLLAPAQRADEFRLFGEIARRVPMARVLAPSGFQHLDALVDAIVDDFRGERRAAALPSAGLSS